MSGSNTFGGDRNPNAGIGAGTTGTTGGPGATDRAGQAASDLADQARETAGQVAGQVKKQTSSVINNQKVKAAQGLGGVAEALRQTSERLGDRDQGTTQQYVEQAAEQLERFSDYIQRTDMGEMLDGVQDLARREPALFFGGALALGLLAGRFMKSSAPTQSRRSSRDRRYAGAARGYYESEAGYARGYGAGPTGRPGYAAPRPMPYEDDIPTGYTPASGGPRPATTGTPGIGSSGIGGTTGTPGIDRTPEPNTGGRSIDRAAEGRPGRITEEP